MTCTTARKLKLEFLVKKDSPSYCSGEYINEYVLSFCGQCHVCRLRKIKDWICRLYFHSLENHQAVFLTLTYRENPVSVQVRDVQLFIKKLRNRYKQSLSYFGCVEYGTLKGRPHAHLTIFIPKSQDLSEFTSLFSDRFIFRSDLQYPVFLSSKLNNIWSHGQCFIQYPDDTLNSLIYSSVYLSKNRTIKKSFFDDYCALSHFATKTVSECVNPYPCRYCPNYKLARKEFNLKKERIVSSSGIGFNSFLIHYYSTYVITRSINIDSSHYNIPMSWVRKLYSYGGDFADFAAKYIAELRESSLSLEERMEEGYTAAVLKYRVLDKKLHSVIDKLGQSPVEVYKLEVLRDLL